MNRDVELYETHYLSYLLRLWQVKATDGTHWRALLESPLTGEKVGFSDMEALFIYLDSITQESHREKMEDAE